MSKPKGQGKGINVPNREAYERMNYLYQAAHYALSSTQPPNVQLARHYCTTLKNIAKRLVLRLDPNIKRSICKRCNCLLVPGLTSTVRLQSHRETHTVVTCKECGYVRRYNMREGHVLWTEREKNTMGADAEAKTENGAKPEKNTGISKVGKTKNGANSEKNTDNSNEMKIEGGEEPGINTGKCKETKTGNGAKPEENSEECEIVKEKAGSEDGRSIVDEGGHADKVEENKENNAGNEIHGSETGKSLEEASTESVEGQGGPSNGVKNRTGIEDDAKNGTAPENERLGGVENDVAGVDMMDVTEDMHLSTNASVEISSESIDNKTSTNEKLEDGGKRDEGIEGGERKKTKRAGRKHKKKRKGKGKKEDGEQESGAR
eukprot:comp11626_c0_seq1/m.6131 comp11626_c0_seq1/g.6131  ORF comp11626_c0_seq1/g.6131 comp11626_c0_seq1/m.6131 type:complete len:376 (-) comp11626_c0_seq1:615-1742(-)